MADGMRGITTREMGEAISIARHVDSWGAGGEMRAFMGDEPKPPSTSLERAAVIAFDVASTGERGFGGATVSGRPDRGGLSALLEAGIRIAVVDERDNGGDGRNDVDRARLVLASMAMVATMREHFPGSPPEPLENPVLEAMRRKSGLESSAFDESDARAVGIGMPDMVKGAEAGRQVVAAVRGAMEPSVDDRFEDRLRMAEATWPAVETRDRASSPPLGASPSKGPSSRGPVAAGEFAAAMDAARARDGRGR